MGLARQFFLLIGTGMVLIFSTSLAKTNPSLRDLAKNSSSVQSSQNQKSEDGEDIDMEQSKNFVRAMYEVKKYYVEPVSDKKLFENAIRGMVQGLDPHSNYLDEEEFNDLRIVTNGEFGGLGIEIEPEENGFIRVVSPVEGGPAERAGLKSGDVIIKLNEKSVRGLAPKQIVGYLRGEPGTSVDVMLQRKENNKISSPRVVKLTREIIKVPSVKSRILQGDIGYIRITQFQQMTGEDFVAAIHKLKGKSKQKIRGLVLDLRNNPGGLLDSAVEVADALIHSDAKGKEELIVLTKGRTPEQQSVIKAQPDDEMNGAPIVCIINEGSASAAEIVAGALQDNKRALIIGTRSFGKGSVQTILPLDDKTGLKITTARYYTPSGRSIQARGIIPDVEVKNVKVTAVKEQTSDLEYHEADLAGHLENETADKNTAVATSSDEEIKILNEDYQLYQAMQLLKGMVVSSRT